MHRPPNISPFYSVEDDPCLGPEEMSAYQAGKAAAAERHRVERHLLACELCSMAYEDFVPQDAPVVVAGAEAISAMAWQKVAGKQKRRVAVIWMSAAASVILLISAGWFFLRQPSTEKMQDVYSEMMTRSLEEDTNITDRRGNELQATAQPTNPADAPKPEWSNSEHESPVMEDPALVIQAKPSPAPLAATATKENFKGVNDNSGPGAYAKDALKAPVPVEAIVEVKEESVASEDEVLSERAGKKIVDSKNDAKGSTFAGIEKRNVAEKESVANSKKFKSPTGGGGKSLAKEPAKTYAAAPAPPSTKGSVNEGLTRNRDESEEKAVMEDDASEDFVGLGESEISQQDSVAVISKPSSFEQGMDAYGRKDFSSAATYLRTASSLTPQNLEAHLYAAISFLNINQPQAAIYHLDRVLAVEGTSLKEDAEWYKALALLKLNEGRKAENQLEVIVAKKGKHSTAAKTALDKLK